MTDKIKNLAQQTTQAAKSTGKAAHSNVMEWKSTLVGLILGGFHLYEHFSLGENLELETLFAAGYIILGLKTGSSNK